MSQLMECTICGKQELVESPLTQQQVISKIETTMRSDPKYMGWYIPPEVHFACVTCFVETEKLTSTPTIH